MKELEYGENVSCRKICKNWRDGLFESFIILLCAERNSGEVCEGFIPFSRGASKCVCRKNFLPSEHENKLLEYCITVDQRYSVRTERSGHKTHGFTVDNKKWVETSI